MHSREIKKHIQQLLHADVPVPTDVGVPFQRQVGPLFGLLLDRDEMIRWRAVMLLAAVTADIAAENMENARIIMRRLMWQLNDESGGIGWGCPEAMGEILATHELLANEYNRILVSYIMPEQNFLEHPVLQRGVVWGVTRLAQSHYEMASPAADALPYVWKDADIVLKGLLIRASGWLHAKSMQANIQKHMADNTLITVFENNTLNHISMADLAEEAMMRM